MNLRLFLIFWTIFTLFSPCQGTKRSGKEIRQFLLDISKLAKEDYSSVTRSNLSDEEDGRAIQIQPVHYMNNKPRSLGFADDDAEDVELLVVNEDGSITVASTNATLLPRSGPIDDDIFQQVFPGFSQDLKLPANATESTDVEVEPTTATTPSTIPTPTTATPPLPSSNSEVKTCVCKNLFYFFLTCFFFKFW